MNDAVRQAMTLAERGDSFAAVARLEADVGNESRLLLGLWRVEGRQMPRDLSAARADFAASAALGNAGAARTLGALLAASEPRDWQGALDLLREWAGRDPWAARQSELIVAMDIDDKGDPLAVPSAAALSASPDIRIVRGLLSPAECDFLTDCARARLRPALIYHEGRREWTPDPVRRSRAAGFPLISEWPAVHALNRRPAATTATDVACGEPLQLLAYAPGDSYRPHLDAVPGLANQRVLTALVYLNDGFDGGETRFVKAGVAFRGGVGDALIFANVDATGRSDPLTEHEGTPVTSGEKLLASRWIRARPPGPDGFGPEEVVQPA